MSFLLENIPYFNCLVRKEYTRDLKDGFGEYLAAVACAVWCRRGRMIGFHVVFRGCDDEGEPTPTGGCMFAQLPIKALCWQPCKQLYSAETAPWDVFSETFTVVEIEFIANSVVTVLPAKATGRYMFTVDFCRSDLADDPEQHKQLHIIRRDDGNFGAYPNNRLIVHDASAWEPTKSAPGFTTLTHVFRSE